MSTFPCSLWFLILIRCDHCSAEGTGIGPRCAVVREALLILLSDKTQWTLREGYLVPNWHAASLPIPFRATLFRAAGTLIMLHFLWIGAPCPVSPYLVLMLFDGIKSFDVDVDFVNNLISPTVSSSLAEWLSLPPNEAFSEELRPLASVLFGDADANISHPFTLL